MLLYKQHYEVNGCVNPKTMKNTARCNFLIMTLKYIKVYISGMEMNQRIRLIVFDIKFY